MARVRGLALGFVLAAAASAASGAQVQTPHGSERTSFSQDEPLEHPVTLSPEVLKVLLENEEAREGLNFAKELARDNPAHLFRAAKVHLGRPDEVDIVVVGTGPMSGVDNDWFWVVLSARKDPKVVLFAGCNSLEVMDSRTNGYRNIRSVWSSASETDEIIYHFNGKQYKVWRKKSTDITSPARGSPQ